MDTRLNFPALLSNAAGFGQRDKSELFAFITFIAVPWICLCSMPLLLLWAARFYVEVFQMMNLSFAVWLVGWLVVVGRWSAGFFFPESVAPTSRLWTEFLFTRPVERSLVYCAKLYVMLFFALTPMVFQLGLSTLQPRMRFAPVDNVPYETPDRFAAEILKTKRYVSVLGARNTTRVGRAPDPRNTPVHIKRLREMQHEMWATRLTYDLSHSTVRFAGAVLWWAAVSVLLMQLYYAALARWRNLLKHALPVLLAMPLLAPVLALMFASSFRLNWFEEAFFFFAGSWVVLTVVLVLLFVLVVSFCERRFAEQEVL